MNTQKIYFKPEVHARTGAVMDHKLFRPEFDTEVLYWGLKPIDAPLALPLGGVHVLCESDRFVHAIDFVSVRAS